MEELNILLCPEPPFSTVIGLLDVNCRTSFARRRTYSKVKQQFLNKKIQILLPAHFINKRHQDIFTQFITWAAIASAYSLSPSAWSPDFSNPFTSAYNHKKIEKLNTISMHTHTHTHTINKQNPELLKINNPASRADKRRIKTKP